MEPPVDMRCTGITLSRGGSRLCPPGNLGHEKLAGAADTGEQAQFASTFGRLRSGGRHFGVQALTLRLVALDVRQAADAFTAIHLICLCQHDASHSRKARRQVKSKMFFKVNGARGRSRTADTAIFSRMLYQLSYPGTGLRANGPPDGGVPISVNPLRCPALRRHFFGSLQPPMRRARDSLRPAIAAGRGRGRRSRKRGGWRPVRAGRKWGRRRI